MTIVSTAWHARSADDVVRELGTDAERGLSAGEAARRLAEFGPNELPVRSGTAPWKLFLEQFRSLVVCVLVVAALASGFLSEWGDAIAILAIVMLNGILGFTQEFRAERALLALRKLAAPTSRVVR
ncbi:MAG: cation-translocating P-type ATPase, partial [Planctomycetes bacterium]|nr:cation-translocating P-type ATPase [Planctomycetota bacterium]